MALPLIPLVVGALMWFANQLRLFIENPKLIPLLAVVWLGLPFIFGELAVASDMELTYILIDQPLNFYLSIAWDLVAGLAEMIYDYLAWWS